MTRNLENSTWTADAVPDQTGRVAVITGANSGIGFVAARALALRGAAVVLACRSLEKGQAAMQRIKADSPEAKVEVETMDLASLASVRSAAQAILSRHPRLDLLINNAGVMAPPHGTTAEGFELQFGTNHLGHFALTGLLLDRLLATAGSRVVTVSSNAHHIGRIRFEDLNFERGYHAWPAYGQSKLANLMFTYELQRRLEKVSRTTLALAAHPGWAKTELDRHAMKHRINQLLYPMLGLFLCQPASRGALPMLRAAVDPAARGGEYYGPSGFLEFTGEPVRVGSNRRSHDVEAQRRLWRVLEQLTGVVHGL